MRLLKRITAGFGMAATAALFVIAGPASVANADGTDALEYNVQMVVDPDGTIHVTETITFANTPSEVVQVLTLAQETIDNREYRFRISNITAENVSSYGSEVTQERATITVVPDSPTFVIKYDLVGAALDAGRGSGGIHLTEVTWPVLQGLSVGVETVTGTIIPGGDIAAQTNFSFKSLDCVSGTVAAPTTCTMYGGGTHDYPYPFFSDGPRAAGEVVIFGFTASDQVIATNENIVELWTLDRAFSVDLLHLLAALGVLVAGGGIVMALLKTKGADISTVKDPTIVAAFTPTGAGTVEFKLKGDVRPGHVGTVADECVDPVDITATILDLAIRGHLQIIELPGKAGPDWTFKRLDGTDKLAPFESTLLSAIAPKTGKAATVSTISGAVTSVIGDVQSQLYDDVVERGWFSARPDSTRNKWAIIGWASVVLAFSALVALVLFTKFGLAGIALVAVAAALVVASHDMPRRTQSGSALLAGLQVLATNLRVQPVDEIEKSKAYSEISEVLPYAVVLGSCERWTQALAAADDDPGVPDPDDLPWYHAEEGWSLSDLPGSIDAFVTATQGRLFGRG